MPFSVLIFRTFVSAHPARARRGRDHRRRLARRACSSRVILPLLRPAIITVIVVDLRRRLQRLRQPAVLPAGHRQCDGPADAVQLPEPVQHALEPAVRGRAADHDPAADHVHLLPAPDRVGHDRRRGQGLTTRDHAHETPVVAAIRRPPSGRHSQPGALALAGGDPLRLSWHVSRRRPRARAARRTRSRLRRRAVVRTAPGRPASVATADQVAATAPGPRLTSREVQLPARPRSGPQAGWSDWSPRRCGSRPACSTPQRLGRADRSRCPTTRGSAASRPSPLLRRSSTLPAASVRGPAARDLARRSTRSPSTAARSRDDLLAPGWTAYRHRLLARHLRRDAPCCGRATNVIARDARGRLVSRPSRLASPAATVHATGREVALIAQLEIEPRGRHDGASSRRTRRGARPPARSGRADLYDGVLDRSPRTRSPGWDAPGFDAAGWAPARGPVRCRASSSRASRHRCGSSASDRPADDRGPRDGSVALDGGQNIAGWVRLTRPRARRRPVVTVRHAEVLEPDGSLHTCGRCASAKATDTYVLADDDETVLEPAFTFHGFRYAEVETTRGAPRRASSWRSAATRPARSTFECADARLNRLHENVVWSQRDNFVSVPTDCPQRDERLGWTGDAQAFAPTGSHALRLRGVLGELAARPRARAGPGAGRAERSSRTSCSAGRPGSVAPAGPTPPRSCRGRCTSRTAIRSGPATPVDSMRALGRLAVARRGPDGLLVPSPQFGDWLDPDAPADRPWEAKADSELLANAFFAHSARLAAAAAAAPWATEGSRVAVRARSPTRSPRLTWARWREHARHDPDRLRGRARPRASRRRANVRRVGEPSRALVARRRRPRHHRVPGHAARAARALRRRVISTRRT